MDYSGCNAKICGNAFDKLGHGAVVCAGPTVTMAWKLNEAEDTSYLDQAKAAAEELLERNSSHESIVNRILNAVKSDDPVMLATVAQEVMALTSAENLVKIAKGPDIKELSEGELLYYISIALSDAGAALLTY